MPYSCLTNVCDPDTLKMLVQVFEKALLEAQRDLRFRDLTQEQEQELRQKLATIIIGAHAGGENDPERLKREALVGVACQPYRP
jgi:hypothetical protein